MSEGIYRRRIRIETGAQTVRAEMEDDPHHYGITLHHDGATITAITGHPIRTPWSLCASAAAPLAGLVGMVLSPHPLAVYRHVTGRHQCTHMLDLAGLAAAHAARRSPGCLYDAEVLVGAERTIPRHAILRRDGVVVLDWIVANFIIQPPSPFADLDTRRMLSPAEALTADMDAFEAMTVLRRASLTSGARLLDLDTRPNAGVFEAMMGSCYVYQPGIADRAERVVGSTLDFAATPERLLSKT